MVYHRNGGLPEEQGQLESVQTLPLSVGYAGNSQSGHRENQIPSDQLKRILCPLLHYEYVSSHG